MTWQPYDGSAYLDFDAVEAWCRALAAAHVPEAFFRPGRAGVLGRILEARPLYPDPTYRARYEAQGSVLVSSTSPVNFVETLDSPHS